jgi:sec-independent protein translocase protein TatB
MFGVDFSELMVIMLVALIVIGPERLPKVARTLGLLWGRAQRYVNGVKADIERDMALEEFRHLTEKIQKEARNAEQDVMQAGQIIDQQVKELNDSVERPVQALARDAVAISKPAPTVQQQVQLELQPPAAEHKFPVD